MPLLPGNRALEDEGGGAGATAPKQTPVSPGPPSSPAPLSVQNDHYFHQMGQRQVSCPMAHQPQSQLQTLPSQAAYLETPLGGQPWPR
jgi:hypothetical protein